MEDKGTLRRYSRTFVRISSISSQNINNFTFYCPNPCIFQIFVVPLRPQRFSPFCSRRLLDVKWEDIIEIKRLRFIVSLENVRSLEDVTIVNGQTSALCGRCLFVTWAFLTAFKTNRERPFFY